MKNLTLFAVIGLAGLSLTACATHGHSGGTDGVFSSKSGASLDTSRRYYDDLVDRYYYYEVGTNRTFFENGDHRSG